ncbi:MAG: methylenetetrahydrofolate reductase C-terminal domain-containing protein [Candidatus Pacebacteria bacterium]|nr:methylenetetrahydrofolate reductase C-terminal domain-containing protein [Candidatus Paceibacterota bacterium]
MAEKHSPQQLKMNFSGENPLASRLRSGEFSILVEYDSPQQEQPLESALAPGKAIAQRIKGHPLVAGMAVTDRLRGEDTHDPVHLAETLTDIAGKPVLLHVSGKGSDTKRIQDLLARAASGGISNILAVTGDRSDKHPPKGPLGRVPKHPVGYRDSVNIVRDAAQTDSPFLVGAAVSPYKYNPTDQYLQYYKMMRKLASGAEFLVSQAGWDMKKLQELQWFLQMRERDVPVIARVMLLSAEDIAHMHEGFLPGVTVSRAFIAMLQRESNINATQSLAAQLQRIGLQVAGCKLLGYSGVQLAGIRDERTLTMVLKRVEETVASLQSYPDWVAAWNEHHNDLQFAPAADAYYAFRNLLDPAQQMYNPDACPMSERPFPKPSRKDLLRAATLRILFAPKVSPSLKQAVQTVICRGCTSAPTCEWQYSAFLCPAACPKQLVYGACGGSGDKGRCEFGHTTCFFHRVLAVMASRHELDLMEAEVPSD